jgi:RNA polymerase sigma-70 factor (ECF subfamily)
MKKYNEVYNKLQPIVLGYLIKFNHGDIEQAEDQASITMEKVLFNLDKYDEEKSKMTTWAINIAKNVAIDATRKRRLSTLSIHDYVDDQGNETIQEQTSVTPYSEMVSKQIGDGIELALSKLPMNYKDIADMYFKKELSYQEISNELQKPLGTIKANIHRARLLLQESLKNVKL